MQYRQLGKYGVRVSEVALGSWLTYGNATQNDVAQKCVDRAYEMGINFFDTANVYAGGRAEEVVGKALSKYPRSSYVLATKLFFPMGDGPNDRGLSRKHIFEQCHKSLARLGTEYIDLYQCHRWDPQTPLEETLMALDDLCRQGKILYYGVSEWTAPQIASALAAVRENHWHPLVSNQPLYNMLVRGIEREIIPLCEREGVGQVVFSPLAQGVLTGKYKPGQPAPSGSRAADPKQNVWMGREALAETALATVQKLAPIAERAGMNLPQMALAWCLRQRSVSSVIIGASRPEQIDNNAQASGKALSSDVLAAIEQALA